MTAPTAKQDNMEQRRAKVAQLRLRLLSSREICQALAQSGIVNPHTGQPYDHKVILSDLAVLKREWKEQRTEVIDEHIDRQFMEQQEIKRAGWSGKDYELVRKTLRDEMELLGTKKAQEVNLNVNINVVIKLIEAIEARGENASDWFLEMLQEMADADTD
jgi:hypothetical protein